MTPRIMTEYRRLTANGEELDLNQCSLDVYEVVLTNEGTSVVELAPFGFLGSPNKPGAGLLTGITLRPREKLRLYAGDKYPRGDQYTVNVTTGGITAINVFLYGIPKVNR